MSGIHEQPGPNQKILRYTKGILPEKKVMASARRACTVRSRAIWRRNRVMVRILRSMACERSGWGTAGSSGRFVCSGVMHGPFAGVVMTAEGSTGGPGPAPARLLWPLQWAFYGFPGLRRVHHDLWHTLTLLRPLTVLQC